MKKTHPTRSLVLLPVLAVALAAVGASSAGSSSQAASLACDKGLRTINGKLWVQYCGPAKATAKFAGRTVRFSSGECIRRTKVPTNKVLAANLGLRILRGTSPKTKFFELAAKLKGDGVYRKDAFVEWIIGTTHYVLVPPLKVTFKNRQTRATFAGKLQSENFTKPNVWRNRGTATGSFSCGSGA